MAASISADIVWRPTENACTDNPHKEDPGSGQESSATNARTGSRTTSINTTSIKKQRSELFRTFKERQWKRVPATPSSTTFSTRHPTVSPSSWTDDDTGHLQEPVNASHSETTEVAHTKEEPLPITAPFESLSAAQLNGEDIEMSRGPENASKAEAQFMLEQLDSIIGKKITR
jgi:hypothetical protein